MAYHRKTPISQRCPKAYSAPSPYRGCLMALEPRMLFDGAALTTAADAVASQPDTANNPTQTPATDSLLQAVGALVAKTESVEEQVYQILNITTPNNAPTLTGVADVTVTFIANNTPSDFDLSSVEVADADGDTLTVNISVTQGTFSAPADGSGVGAGVTATLDNAQTIRLVGSASDINTYLDTTANIQYLGNNAATYMISVTDNSAPEVQATANININNAPILYGLRPGILIAEDVPVNLDLVMSPTALEDADGDELTLTMELSAGTFSTVTNAVDVTENLSADNQTLTLVGSATALDNYLKNTTNLQYTGDLNANQDNAPIPTLRTNLSDGIANTDAPSTTNIVITPVDDAPTLDCGNAPTTITVAEDTTTDLDLSELTLDEVDGDNLTLTLTIGAGTGTTTTLGSFGTPPAGAGVGAGVTETRVNDQTITLVGSATDINTYLDNNRIQYTGAQGVNGQDVNTITASVADNTTPALPAATTCVANINISTSNPPTLTCGPDDITVTEDTAGNLDLSAMEVADVDGGNLTLTLTIGTGTSNDLGTFSGVADANDVTETLSNNNRTLALVGSVTALNAYLNNTTSIQYTGATNVNGDNANIITATLADDTNLTAANTCTTNIDITAVNDAPTMVCGPDDLTVTEDVEGNLNLSAMEVADVDSTSLTLTLTLNAGAFSTVEDVAGITETLSADSQTLTLVGSATAINSYLDTAANIRYTGALNANGDNAALLTANVSDGSLASTPDCTTNIDITAVDDAPTLDCGNAPTEVTLDEDATVDLNLSELTLGDVDGDNLTLTLTIGAGTGATTTLGSFSTPADGSGIGAGVTETLVDNQTITLSGSAADINTYLDNNNLQYTGAQDVNGQNVNTITATMVDNTTGALVAATSCTATVHLTPVDDAPTLDCGNAPTEVTLDEDATVDLNLSELTLGDVDGDNLTLTLTIGAGTGATTTLGSFSAPADGSTIGAGVTETLVDNQTITLSGSAADINTYLDNNRLQYTGAQDVNGQNVNLITATVVDNTTGALVAATSCTASIDLAPVNDAPTVACGPDVTVPEDTQSNFDLSGLSVADIDGDNLTLTLTIDAGTFNSVADGAAQNVTATLVNGQTITLVGSADNINSYLDTVANLQYTGDLNVNGQDVATLTAVVTDGTATANCTTNIDITANNTPPTLTGVTNLTMAENTTNNFDLSNLTVADIDGDNLTLTLTVNAGAFNSVADGAALNVTETLVNDQAITLAGLDTAINTYLDTASNIQYTSIDNPGGNNVVVPFTVSVTDGTATVANPASIDIPTVAGQPVIRHLPLDIPTPNDTPEEEEEPAWDNPVEITVDAWQLMAMGAVVVLPGADSCACANPEIASPDLGSCGTVGPDAVDLDIYLDTPPDIIQYLPTGEEQVDPAMPDGYQQSTATMPDHGQALLAAADAATLSDHEQTLLKAADAIQLPDSGYGPTDSGFAQCLQAVDSFTVDQARLVAL